MANGAMVALYPTPELAAQLAQPGGEPAERLHLTLAFLGPAALINDVDGLKRCVAEFAASTAPIVGSISGIGHFDNEGEQVTYASVDAPALPVAREKLISAIQWSAEPSRLHGFTPHVTLALDDRAGVILPEDRAIRFDTVSLVLAGERTDFPLYGTYTEWTVPLWKADDAPDDDGPLTVYGVVLQPGIPDSQGDVLSAGEIEKAAHEYLVTSRKQDLQHNETAAAVDVVESYIAPADLIVAGRPVVKGAWVMASDIRDPAIKAGVRKGEITGYSIGGTAVRTA